MFAPKKQPQQQHNLVEYGSGVNPQNGCKAMQQTSPISDRSSKAGDRRDHSDSEGLFEEGLRCYRKCFGFMKEHWADFPVSDRTKALEWKDLLAGFKHKILALRSREMRNEIQALWEKSYLGDAQKRLSAAYRSASCDEAEDVSEAALHVLREEMRSLRAYHHRHNSGADILTGERRCAPAVRRELIDLLRQYEAALKALDAAAAADHHHQRSSASNGGAANNNNNNTQERLHNRGAVLLREERHRKLLAKMQKTILRLIREKEKHGEVFLVNGEHFETVIERDKKLIQAKIGIKQMRASTPPPPVSSPPSRSASSRRARSGTSSRGNNNNTNTVGGGGGGTSASLRTAVLTASSAPPPPSSTQQGTTTSTMRHRALALPPSTRQAAAASVVVGARRCAANHQHQQQRNGASSGSPVTSTVSCLSPPASSHAAGRRLSPSQHPMRNKKSNTTTVCTSRRGQHLRSGYFSS